MKKEDIQSRLDSVNTQLSDMEKYIDSDDFNSETSAQQLYIKEAKGYLSVLSSIYKNQIANLK